MEPASATPPADDLLRPPDAGRAWIVIHTRPRCEKKAADFCARHGIPAYLPLQQKVHRYGARVRPFWSPLFPGYAFGLVDPPQQALVRQNRATANVLEVLDQDLLVRQLRQVRAALAAGDVLELLPYLEAGKRVRVTGGPLKGAEGVVLRVKGATRIVLNVDMIRQSVAVEMDSGLLAPA